MLLKLMVTVMKQLAFRHLLMKPLYFLIFLDWAVCDASGRKCHNFAELLKAFAEL